MRRIWKPFLVLTTLAAGLALTAVPATAAGVGAYLQGNAGSATWEFKSPNSGNAELDANTQGVGLGFVFDTNCARDELVNYRVNAGFEYNDLNFDDVSEDDSTLGIYFDNFIGFGVIRNPKLRLWVGPEVRLGYFKGMGDGLTNDMTGAEFSVGPAVGLNLHLGREMDLALTTGVRLSMVSGSWDDNGSDEDFDGNSTTFYFNVSLLFRGLDDTFAAK